MIRSVFQIVLLLMLSYKNMSAQDDATLYFFKNEHRQEYLQLETRNETVIVSVYGLEYHSKDVPVFYRYSFMMNNIKDNGSIDSVEYSINKFNDLFFKDINVQSHQKKNWIESVSLFYNLQFCPCPKYDWDNEKEYNENYIQVRIFDAYSNSIAKEVKIYKKI